MSNKKQRETDGDWENICNLLSSTGHPPPNIFISSPKQPLAGSQQQVSHLLDISQPNHDTPLAMAALCRRVACLKPLSSTYHGDGSSLRGKTAMFPQNSANTDVEHLCFTCLRESKELFEWLWSEMKMLSSSRLGYLNTWPPVGGTVEEVTEPHRCSFPEGIGGWRRAWRVCSPAPFQFTLSASFVLS